MSQVSAIPPNERREMQRCCSDALIARGLQRPRIAPRKPQVVTINRRDLSKYRKKIEQ